MPVGGPGLPASIGAIGATADAPALVPVNGALGDLAAADVLERGTKRLQVVDGKQFSMMNGKPVIPLFDAGV